MNVTHIYSNDFLDILFAGRNKDYGAYDLRRSQDRRLRNAVIGTASLALVIIGGYVIDSRLMAADMRTRKPDIEVFKPIAPIDPNLEKARPVTPPPPAHAATPPPASSSIIYASPTITDQEVINEVPPIESIGNKTIGVTNTPGDDVNGSDAPDLPGTGPGSGVVEPPKGPDHTTTFTTVEINPSFPGGEAALVKFLQKNIHYPRMAAENDIMGRVSVQFIVDWEGNITGIKIISNRLGGGLEEEAMRVVKLMPKWNPGKQNGQTVNVQFNLPVAFFIQQ
jgi:protein TonB